MIGRKILPTLVLPLVTACGGASEPSINATGAVNYTTTGGSANISSFNAGAGRDSFVATGGSRLNANAVAGGSTYATPPFITELLKPTKAQCEDAVTRRTSKPIEPCSAKDITGRTAESNYNEYVGQCESVVGKDKILPKEQWCADATPPSSIGLPAPTVKECEDAVTRRTSKPIVPCSAQDSPGRTAESNYNEYVDLCSPVVGKDKILPKEQWCDTKATCDTSASRPCTEDELQMYNEYLNSRLGKPAPNPIDPIGCTETGSTELAKNELECKKSLEQIISTPKECCNTAGSLTRHNNYVEQCKPFIIPEDIVPKEQLCIPQEICNTAYTGGTTGKTVDANTAIECEKTVVELNNTPIACCPKEGTTEAKALDAKYKNYADKCSPITGTENLFSKDHWCIPESICNIAGAAGAPGTGGTGGTTLSAIIKKVTRKGVEAAEKATEKAVHNVRTGHINIKV